VSEVFTAIITKKNPVDKLCGQCTQMLNIKVYGAYIYHICV